MTAGRVVLVGAVIGMLGVIFGAFGAHGLEGRVTPERLVTFEIGVRYQMFHAAAVLASAALVPVLGGAWVGRAVACFAAGVAIFSGSLYLLVLTGQDWLGAITPIGGVLLIAGWAVLGWGAWRSGRAGAGSA